MLGAGCGWGKGMFGSLGRGNCRHRNLFRIFVIPGYPPGSGVRCDNTNSLLINKHYCCCESIIENMISKSMFVLTFVIPCNISIFIFYKCFVANVHDLS